MRIWLARIGAITSSLFLMGSFVYWRATRTAQRHPSTGQTGILNRDDVAPQEHELIGSTKRQVLFSGSDLMPVDRAAGPDANSGAADPIAQNEKPPQLLKLPSSERVGSHYVLMSSSKSGITDFGSWFEPDQQNGEEAQKRDNPTTQPTSQPATQPVDSPTKP